MLIYQHGSQSLACFMSILVFNILLLKYLDFHIMTWLFSNGVVNNYGQEGGRVGWNRGCMKYFGENQIFLTFMGGGSENVLGYYTWNMLINIMAWKCNGEFVKSFYAFERGHENCLHIRRGIMKYLPSWNISSCPSPQYYKIEYLVYFIDRTMVEVRECYHSSYVVCVVVFLLGIVWTIIIYIIWQNVIYC